MNVVHKYGGTSVATIEKIQAVADRVADKSLEESLPRLVRAHQLENGRIAAQRREGDTVQDVRDEGLLHETVATNTASVTQDAVQDVAQHPLPVRLLREGLLQDGCHAGPHEEIHQKVSIAENGMGLRLGERLDLSAQALVIPSDIAKGVVRSIIGHKAALRGKEDAGLAVRAEPHDLPQAFTHDLPGMELSSIPDIPGLLDGSAAAGDVAAAVPDQLLNPDECHVANWNV